MMVPSLFGEDVDLSVDLFGTYYRYHATNQSSHLAMRPCKKSWHRLAVQPKREVHVCYIIPGTNTPQHEVVNNKT